MNVQNRVSDLLSYNASTGLDGLNDGLHSGDRCLTSTTWKLPTSSVTFPVM